MLELVVLLVLFAAGSWLYRLGKGVGSRKGYNVGRARRRRR
jgi:hypothetical protein